MSRDLILFRRRQRWPPHIEILGNYAVFFFTPFSWYPIVSSYYLVSSLQLPYGLMREPCIESHASSETQPNQATLLLNTARLQPGSQPHQCVGGNTVHLVTWLACTAPGPPQELLVRDETRISLPAKPSLTRTTLGQLCVAPWTSRSRSAATEPGLEPRVSGGTAMQCPRPLRHPGGPYLFFLRVISYIGSLRFYYISLYFPVFYLMLSTF